MTKLIDLLKSEYSSEYSINAFILRYSKPKIYPKIVASKAPSAFSAKEKKEILTKYSRWYVYYMYLNPDTDKLTLQNPVYFNVNRKFKDFDSRLHHIKIIRNSIERLLKNGFSPYENNTMPSQIPTAKGALDYALELKKEYLKQTSYKDYFSRVNQFQTFLDQEYLLYSPVYKIDKKVVNKYLNIILKKSSPRNRNNTRTILSAVFSVLEDNEVIDRNFIKYIKPLKTNPERNKTYSIQKVTEIYNYLNSHDKILLLYIKFVSYNFLRPIEVCRLTVNDIDIQNKHINIKAKNKAIKTKLIPDILISDLNALQLHKFKANDYIFTPKGIGNWKSNEVDRRNYFTKRYRKIKTALSIGPDYTIYSFRHTFITKLYRELRNLHSQSTTYDKLMLITGHSSLKALQQYLRDIDAELPDDYSEYLK